MQPQHHLGSIRKQAFDAEKQDLPMCPGARFNKRRIIYETRYAKATSADLFLQMLISQTRNVSRIIPDLSAIEEIAAHWVGCSALVVKDQTDRPFPDFLRIPRPRRT